MAEQSGGTDPGIPGRAPGGSADGPDRPAPDRGVPGRAAARLLDGFDRADAERERETLLRGIADYVEHERALTNRLAEQSALVELAPDPIFVRDADRRITFWNEAAELLYGFTREEAIGRRASELLRTEYPAALEEIERRVGEQGVWAGDLVQTARDGRRLTVASRWGRCMTRRARSWRCWRSIAT